MTSPKRAFTPRNKKSSETPDGLPLRLALALGPGQERALPWPVDLDAWFHETWKRERQRYPRWAGARRPSELLRRMARLAQRLADLKATPLFLNDLAYPEAFRGLSQPPAVLFCRGSQPPRGARVVAVVGSRAAYREDLDRARDLGQTLSAAGVVVVSGGALGIDAAAHEGVLHALKQQADAVPTIAVLGSGLGQPYPPRNRPLFERIVSTGGWLISPYLPDEPGKRWHFPARNTLIAALADLTVVVAAAERSGALDTAAKALRLGRTLGAFPFSKGCKRLVVTRKASALNTSPDVLALLRGEKPRLPGLASEDRTFLAHLSRDQGMSIDDLADRAGLGIGRTTLLLLRLELQGAVCPEAGGRYRRLVELA